MKKAEQIDPNDSYVLLNLGQTYGIHGNYEEGMKCLEKAIKIDPNNPIAYYLKTEYLGNIKNNNI